MNLLCGCDLIGSRKDNKDTEPPLEIYTTKLSAGRDDHRPMKGRGRKTFKDDALNIQEGTDGKLALVTPKGTIDFVSGAAATTPETIPETPLAPAAATSAGRGGRPFDTPPKTIFVDEPTYLKGILHNLSNTQTDLRKAIASLVSLRTNSSQIVQEVEPPLECPSPFLESSKSSGHHADKAPATKSFKVHHFQSTNDVRDDIKIIQDAVTAAKETVDEICMEISAADLEEIMPKASDDSMMATPRPERNTERGTGRAEMEAQIESLRRDLEGSMNNTKHVLSVTVNALTEERDMLTNALRSKDRELHEANTQVELLAADNVRLVNQLEESEAKLKQAVSDGKMFASHSRMLSAGLTLTRSELNRLKQKLGESSSS